MKAYDLPGWQVAYRTPDWEIKREVSPGYFRVYAHGYWRRPFVVCVLGRVLVGRRGIRKAWKRLGVRDDS